MSLYPVKSLGGVAVESAVVEPWGLSGDRRWAIVDVEGRPVTARDVNALLGISASPLPDGVRLSARGGASIDVAWPDASRTVAVDFTRYDQALLAAESASNWLSERIGSPIRLVWQPDPRQRTLNPERGGLPGESVSLADAGPLLLCSEASLACLNRWIGQTAEEAGAPYEPIDMRRFRPNLVIDGAEAFSEESWPRVRVGDVVFRTTMVCDRCVMTTIDPDTLRRGHEPIRSLARHHRWDGVTWFGTRLVAEGPGSISLSDPVVPLAA